MTEPNSDPSRVADWLNQWARTVEEIERGYPLTFDDYLNDLDLRRILGEATLSHRQSRHLAILDQRFSRATYPAGDCLWGAENAAAEGWNRRDHWYYWRLPVKAGDAFGHQPDSLDSSDTTELQ